MRTDRWLIDGDCEKCRRRSYCSKACTKQNRRTKIEVGNLVSHAILKSTGLIRDSFDLVIDHDHVKAPFKSERSDTNGNKNQC